MKNTSKKLLAIIMTIVTLFGIFVIPIEAKASEDFLVETVKDDVPLWSEPRKASTKVRVVEEKGTLFLVKAQVENEHDHVWYLLENRNWVYSENVRRHDHQSTMCGVPEKKYSCIDEKRHSISITEFDLCDCGYRLNERYSNTSESHNFDPYGKCNDCGFVFTRIFKENRVYVQLKENCSYFSEPTKYGTNLGTLVKGETVETTGVTTNEYGNVWYKKLDGSYFFSGHVDHEHVGSMCGQTNTTYVHYNDTEHSKNTYNGDILCRCGFKIGDGTTSTITESHNYVQGVCTDCGFIFNRVFTENKVWIRLGEDCYSYSAPSKDSDKLDLHIANEDIFTLGTIVNEHENTWFKLVDGTFIFDGHISHIHSGVNCGQGWNEYQQSTEDTHITYSNNGGEYCSCGFQVEENSVTQFEEEHDYDDTSFCSKCGYHKNVEDSSVESNNYKDNETSDTNNPISDNNQVKNSGEESDEEKVVTEEKSTDDSDIDEYICVNYEDCTSDGSDIYIINENNCPIRKSPSLFGKVVSKAKAGQLVSVKDVSWHLLSLSRWAELNVSDSSEKYYIHIGNIKLHDTHNYVNALTTNKGSVDFCSICGVGKATLQNESTTCDLTCVLEQAAIGSFSTQQTSFISIVAQIIVGEIPGLGTLADCRDLIGDIMNGEPAWVIAMDFVALLPLVGMLKYSDELAVITKNSNELVQASSKSVPDMTKKIDNVFNGGYNVKIEGRGSTGRIIPANTAEKIAMENTLNYPFDPGEGNKVLKKLDNLGDERWEGWEKWEVIYYVDNYRVGEDKKLMREIKIHFNYDPVNNLFDDFKFKNKP